MTFTALLALGAGVAMVLIMVGLAIMGPSPARERARRLHTIRERYAMDTETRVEAQLRKALAQRHQRKAGKQSASSHLAALAQRLERTGKPWILKQFGIVCLGLTVFVALAVFILTGAFLIALGIGLIVGLGLPYWITGYLGKRRKKKFIAHFADAIELLVRGLRSGLPVSETLGLVVSEVPAPVCEEFKLVTERIRIGKSMEEALQESSDRLDLPEFSFFCITLAIQRETGGNLAETLSNLAEVLRQRAQMKLKISAMSSESKASAIIVGVLPVFVAVLVWWMNPDYLSGFFTDPRLMIAGGGGIVWMGIGAFVMSQMISFEI